MNNNNFLPEIKGVIQTPLFLVFEGIDGAGKTTLREYLKKYLESHNYQVLSLNEPTSGETGQKIRSLLTGDKMPDLNELLGLFIEDRDVDVRDNIIPALKNKKIILMDRYYYSNIAYQGASGIDPEKVLEMNRSNNFPEPDRVYFVDIDVETALTRINSRNKGEGRQNDCFEKKNFLEKVRSIFLEFAGDNFKILNGVRKPEEIVHEVILDMINKFSVK